MLRACDRFGEHYAGVSRRARREEDAATMPVAAREEPPLSRIGASRLAHAMTRLWG